MKYVYGWREYDPCSGMSCLIVQYELEEGDFIREYEDGEVSICERGTWYKSFKIAKRELMKKMERDLFALRIAMKQLNEQQSAVKK